MIKLKKTNKKELELSQIISKDSYRKTIIEVQYPKTLDFDEILSPDDFFKQNVEQKKSLYNSDNLNLNLLYTKYINENNMIGEKVKTSLSLFSHQYINKLEDYRLSLPKKIQEEDFLEQVKNITNDIIKILSSFRELPISKSEESELKFFFYKMDFLLSFETEQFFLHIINIIQNNKEFNELREQIVLLANNENDYRIDHKYHSKDGNFHLTDKNNDKFIRILNKIEMRKKIIELPLKISEQKKEYGKKEQYISLGISTGFIMLVVGFILFQARLLGMDTTLQFVFALSVLYIFRDLFKEKIKEVIYQKIISKRPKIKSYIYIPSNNNYVGISKTWFFKENYFNKKYNYNDKSILKLKERIRLYDFSHYGFKKFKTKTNINLMPILNKIKRDSRKLYIYSENNSKSKNIKLPRQYKITLKIKEETYKKNYFNMKKNIVKKESEFLILINRDEIISIKEKGIN